MMLTKEELLQKGHSEEEADRIIAALDAQSSTEESPLSALQKALVGEPKDTLSKAEKEGDDEPDEEDYNEEYMKKNMKRYMKENKKACLKMMKEAGAYSDDMQKATDSIDLEGTDAWMVEAEDLRPVLETFAGIGEVVATMAKAIETLSNDIEIVKAQNSKSFDLMQKAAAVTAAQGETMELFSKAMSQPAGRKGVVATMTKAGEVTPGQVTPEQNKFIYSTLMKAVKGGNREAGEIIGVFEAAGHDANKLNADHRRKINALLSQEAK